MLFRPTWLSMVILTTIVFSRISSREIICYIKDQSINWSYEKDPFWGKLPTDNCTRFILIIDQSWYPSVFDFLHGLIKSKKLKDAKMDLGFFVKSKNFDRINTLGLSSSGRDFDGINLIWTYSLFPIPEKEKLKLADKTKQMDKLKKKELKGDKLISQGVLCFPGTNEYVSMNDIVKTADLTIVLVKLRKENINKFLTNPNECLAPLKQEGIPMNKIAIGLKQIYGSSKFREVCKDEDMINTFNSIALALGQLVNAKGLYGVVVWHLNFDDWSGEECKMGTYPLLAMHHKHLKVKAKKIEVQLAVRNTAPVINMARVAKTVALALLWSLF